LKKKLSLFHILSIIQICRRRLFYFLDYNFGTCVLPCSSWTGLIKRNAFYRECKLVLHSNFLSYQIVIFTIQFILTNLFFWSTEKRNLPSWNLLLYDRALHSQVWNSSILRTGHDNLSTKKQGYGQDFHSLANNLDRLFMRDKYSTGRTYF
jgi:hypothetical protein